MTGEAFWRGAANAVYGAGVLAWAGAVWFLPSGNVLWPAALLAGFAMPGVNRIARVTRGCPATAWAGGAAGGAVGGVWWGLALFSAVVQLTGLPYRPDVLHGLLLLGSGMGLSLTALAYGGGRAWGWACAVWLAVAAAGWSGLYLQGVAPFITPPG